MRRQPNRTEWNATSLTHIPRFDGSIALDWITNPFRIAPGDLSIRNRGSYATMKLQLVISAYSGSGSNTWTSQVVWIRNPEHHPRKWSSFDVPRVTLGPICPLPFTQAALPFRQIVEAPFRLIQYAISFTRTGAGTNALEVQILNSLM